MTHEKAAGVLADPGAMAAAIMMAAEMAVIRLTHVADLPDPEKLIRDLQAAPPAPRGRES